MPTRFHNKFRGSSEFEMKDYGRTRLCLGLELEHRVDRCLGILTRSNLQAPHNRP